MSQTNTYDSLFAGVPVVVEEPADRDSIVALWQEATLWTPSELLGRLRYRLPGAPKLKLRFSGPNIVLNLAVTPDDPQSANDQLLSLGLNADRNTGTLTAEILRFDQTRLLPVHHDQLLGNLQDLATGLGLTRVGLRRTGMVSLEDVCRMASLGFVVDSADQMALKGALAGAGLEAGDIFLPRLTRLLHEAANNPDVPLLERLDREPDPAVRRLLANRSIPLTKPLLLDLKDSDSARRFDRTLRRNLTPPNPQVIPGPRRF